MRRSTQGYTYHMKGYILTQKTDLPHLPGHIGSYIFPTEIKIKNVNNKGFILSEMKGMMRLGLIVTFLFSFGFTVDCVTDSGRKLDQDFIEETWSNQPAKKAKGEMKQAPKKTEKKVWGENSKKTFVKPGKDMAKKNGLKTDNGKGTYGKKKKALGEGISEKVNQEEESVTPAPTLSPSLSHRLLLSL